MALELRQQLKLSQQLVMTPQLQQSIKLLQLSRMDLVETVRRELMENPFLEESVDQPTMDEKRQQAEPERKPDHDQENVYDRESSRNEDWEDYLGDFASSPRDFQQRDIQEEEGVPAEVRYSRKPTLSGHLMWQLHLSDMKPEEVAIGENIIGNLSSTGYLQASLEEIADMSGCKPEEVERVLKRIQLFDPVGVAARTPVECLMIQIREKGLDRDPVLVDLVENHLEDFENNRLKPIMKKFKLDEDDLREYFEVIRSLDPMPGSSFGGSEPVYVSPDVYVRKIGGDFVILLNEDGLPRLTVSDTLENDTRITDKEKEYCTEKKRAASWLIRSLEQRNRTLYRVMESIVHYQRDFFENGVSALKPLILRDVAEEIGMHESTVSRITTNKYVSTPFGIFELKFFFNSGVSLQDGSQVGSESVRALIKKLIAEENPQSPLSDEELVKQLKEKLGITIARRTVAKYRGALNIPSSSKRRKVL